MFIGDLAELEAEIVEVAFRRAEFVYNAAKERIGNVCPTGASAA
jgi:hypothetical protein